MIHVFTITINTTYYSLTLYLFNGFIFALIGCGRPLPKGKTRQRFRIDSRVSLSTNRSLLAAKTPELPQTPRPHRVYPTQSTYYSHTQSPIPLKLGISSAGSHTTLSSVSFEQNSTKVFHSSRRHRERKKKLNKTADSTCLASFDRPRQRNPTKTNQPQSSQEQHFHNLGKKKKKNTTTKI